MYLMGCGEVKKQMILENIDIFSLKTLRILLFVVSSIVGDGFMKNDPVIVKILRQEERLGKLQNRTSTTTKWDRSYESVRRTKRICSDKRKGIISLRTKKDDY